MFNIIASLDIVEIIAIIALLSPPVTALIENIFKLIAKWIDYKHLIYENEYNHKRDLFENFLYCSGLVAAYWNKENINKLLHAYYVIIPYIPKNKFRHFRNYCNLIQEDENMNEDEAHRLLHDEIVPCIKKELNRHKPLRQ